MKRPARLRVISLALVLGFGMASGHTALAGPFSAVKRVNDRAITQFEYDQRLLFMRILRQPGDVDKLAMDSLIDDKLRMGAADRFGIKLSPDQVKAGMDEFAGRANLDTEKFLEIVAGMGLQPQTFRDFIEAGLVWREIVRGRFTPQVSITDAQIDRALANFKPLAELNLRVSEIVIPATGAGRGEAIKQAQRLRREMDVGTPFSELAQKNSTGPTAGRGGVMDWQGLTDFDPDAIEAVRTLQPNQISKPIILDDKVVIYQMLEVKQVATAPKTLVVDYAELLLPDDSKSVANVRANVDNCDDLYAMAKGLPADRLTRKTLPVAQLPAAVAGILAGLDAGESSTATTRSGYRVFLMLCRRGAALTEEPSREEVRVQLTNQQLGSYSEIYLQELRSEAIISAP